MYEVSMRYTHGYGLTKNDAEADVGVNGPLVEVILAQRRNGPLYGTVNPQRRRHLTTQDNDPATAHGSL